MNLPSSTLKPKLTGSLFYADLKYEGSTTFDMNASVLDHKPNPDSFLAEITIKTGTGIPLPDEASFPRKLIAKRAAYVSFFDIEKKVPVGNTCKIISSWAPEFEDRW